MATTSGSYVDQDQLEQEVGRIRQMLGPEVVRVRCHTGLDNSDEPAIYVYVVLTDEASRRDVWGEAAPRVRRTLWDELKPFENWGRRLYISFRSHSEYIQMNDPLW